MTRKGLSRLLVVHGVITMAAGIVLAIAPGLIPSAVAIELQPNAYVLAYLLSGAEIGFAVLSFGGARLTDTRALRLIVWSCIVFHGMSGILETYAWIEGVSVVILGNVVTRLLVIGLFASAFKGLPTSSFQA